jgi:hypothetical protein
VAAPDADGAARRASGDEAERNLALAAGLLACVFLVYLVWSLGPTLTLHPCHR